MMIMLLKNSAFNSFADPNIDIALALSLEIGRATAPRFDEVWTYGHCY